MLPFSSLFFSQYTSLDESARFLLAGLTLVFEDNPLINNAIRILLMVYFNPPASEAG
jgi:hypothetical protein